MTNSYRSEDEVVETNEHEYLARDKTCFFCAIHAKAKKSEIIFETDNFYVMINEHRVVRKGRPLCLIFPKEHLLTVDDFNEVVAGDFMDAIVKSSNLLNRAYGTQGTRIWAKSGKASWAVPHLHCHVMPVNGFIDYPILILKLAYHVIQDTLFGSFFSKRRNMNPTKLKKMADELRQHIYF